MLGRCVITLSLLLLVLSGCAPKRDTTKNATTVGFCQVAAPQRGQSISSPAPSAAAVAIVRYDLNDAQTQVCITLANVGTADVPPNSLEVSVQVGAGASHVTRRSVVAEALPAGYFVQLPIDLSGTTQQPGHAPGENTNVLVTSTVVTRGLNLSCKQTVGVMPCEEGSAGI
jgi:hypothetical protein